VFGPDVGALKVKTTCQKPAPVVSDYVEIPKEHVYNHQSVVLCMDGIKFNDLPFLTTIFETSCIEQLSGSHTKLQKLTGVCSIMCFILTTK
jgi:hypothetical protein